jgi:hypothetical protein
MKRSADVVEAIVHWEHVRSRRFASLCHIFLHPFFSPYSSRPTLLAPLHPSAADKHARSSPRARPAAAASAHPTPSCVLSALAAAHARLACNSRLGPYFPSLLLALSIRLFSSLSRTYPAPPTGVVLLSSQSFLHSCISLISLYPPLRTVRPSCHACILPLRVFQMKLCVILRHARLPRICAYTAPCALLFFTFAVLSPCASR